MRPGFSALSAISILACANVVCAAQAPLAVYYSFDKTASPAILSVMRSELTGILAPSGMSAVWVSSEARQPGQDFAGLVVFRFHGRCGFDGVADKRDNDVSGKPLAETDTIDGHVLPYATVNCDTVRGLIAPVSGSMPPDWKTQMLGRALARVTAHEIYHMLAGVRTHDDRGGIFQASHSRKDLTQAVFVFAAPENNWLHAWVERQTREQVAQVVPVSAVASADEPAFSEPDSAVFAGR